MLSEKKLITINEVQYIFNIYIERRNSTRASICKNGVNIRVPKRISKHRQSEEIQKLINWAVKRISKNPQLTYEKNKLYVHLDSIKIFEKVYTLNIIVRDSEKNFSKLNGNVIEFKIAKKHKHNEMQKYISKQLRKILAQNHLNELYNRVKELNEIHFNKTVNNVSFQYTKSRWGSCSMKCDLKFSTKLLLAPPQVLDYVIIHELAHLIHMNHSKNFWTLVKSADPIYKKKIKWLKEYGHTLII